MNKKSFYWKRVCTNVFVEKIIICVSQTKQQFTIFMNRSNYVLNSVLCRLQICWKANNFWQQWKFPSYISITLVDVFQEGTKLKKKGPREFFFQLGIFHFKWGMKALNSFDYCLWHRRKMREHFHEFCALIGILSRCECEQLVAKHRVFNLSHSTSIKIQCSRQKPTKFCSCTARDENGIFFNLIALIFN